MKKIIAVLAVLVCFAFAGSAFAAGDAQHSSQLNFNYPGDCFIGSSDAYITYDRYNGGPGEVDVIVNCSNKLNYTITVDGGLNASGQLRAATMGANKLIYRLYTDQGYTQELGTTDKVNNIVKSDVGTGDYTDPVPVFVFASPNDNPSTTLAVSGSGVYTDIINLTVSY